MKIPLLAVVVCSILPLVGARAEIEVSSLADLARVAAQSGQQIRLRPGVYRMADYLTEPVLAGIRAGVDHAQKRPPVPMFVFLGNDNRIDCTDVVL